MNSEKEKVTTTETESNKEKSVNFYPDLAFNKKERRKTLILSVILIIFLGGMGISVLIPGFQNPENPMGWISGALMLFLLIFCISIIPGAFKQFPVKNEPVVTVTSKEITIMGTTYKHSDVKSVRLTITVGAVGNKAENEKFLDSLVDKEPPAHVTANLDFAVPDKKGKITTVYTTICDGYESLVALYKAGIKHYSIVYSLKKLARQSTYSIGNTKTSDGKPLSELSKKERRQQLF
ncbi:MAG: hypothetical protein IJC87_02315 [Clostridia bacterium]|nr:hypothetical protein [Clostridia bacterium]